MKTEHERLMAGEVVAAGRKLYQRCGVCGGIVRINKPIVGSMHFCLTEEERALREDQWKPLTQQEMNRRLL